MSLNTEVAVGDILTIGALLLTVITIVITWQKDRVLRSKEYSAPIRRASGLVIAKIERWRSLSLRFFDNIQPLLTDADVLLADKKDITVVRDSLWRALVEARALYNQKVIDEQIETSYADLYGYDSRIQVLFTEVIEQLQTIDKAIFTLLLELTELNVMKSVEPFKSASLGNKLRESSSIVFQLNKSLMDRVVQPFRLEMTKLINATDKELVNKRVEISDPKNIFLKLDDRKFSILLEELDTIAVANQLNHLIEACRMEPHIFNPRGLTWALQHISHHKTRIQFKQKNNM